MSLTSSKKWYDKLLWTIVLVCLWIQLCLNLRVLITIYF